MSTPRCLTPGDRFVPWAGAVKKGWPLVPLGVVAAVNKRVLPETTPPDRRIRYVDISSVDSKGNITEVADLTFDSAPSRARRVPVDGDTIISTVRTYLKSVAFMQRPEHDLVCSTGFAVLSPRALIHPKYLFYWVLSDRFVDEVCARSVGVSYPALRPTEMAHLPVAVPPLPVQRAIADHLDRENSAIDALIAKKERLVSVLEEERQAIIDHVILRGVDAGVSVRETGTALGAVPEHWSVTRLMHLTPVARPIMYGIVLPGPSVEDGVPIVKSGNCVQEKLQLSLLHRTTTEIEAGYVRSRLAANDVVYAIRGSVGMAALVPPEVAGANLTQDAARIAPAPGVSPRWLLFLVSSHTVWCQLEAGVVGATVKGINIRDLKRPWVPVPPAEEQIVIADHLEAVTGRLDGLIRKTSASIERLREYRQALITAAVTGQLDIAASQEAA